jgi:hypothetical protein
MITIRRGITRTVLLTTRWAIKLPSVRAYHGGLTGVLWSITRGIQANLSEKAWSTSPGVCPVRWSLAGLINIYPRCRPVNHDLTDADYTRIGFLGSMDRKPTNVGYHQGQLVWLDYDMSWNDCRVCAP